MIARWTTVDKKAEDESQIDLSPYAYVGNDPISKDDPDGNCPMCVGFVVGALVDAALQTVDIALYDKKTFSKDFSVTSVIVSGAAGAIGVGIAAKVAKAVEVAELGSKVLGAVIKRGADAATSAAASAASQKLTTGKIDGTKIAIDAVAGALGGHLGDKAEASAAKSATGKLLAKDANRAARVAVGSRASRATAAAAAAAKSANFTATRAAAVAVGTSGTAGTAVKDVVDKTKQN